MKKILILVFICLYPVQVFSAINEYKIDVYFANGILTKDSDARKNALEILRPEIIEKIGYSEYKRDIGEVGYSYNQTTESQLGDSLEAMLQKFDWDNLLDYFYYEHFTDVRGHVEKYKSRILLGHKVLVVAHSQGNLFALDTYEKLGEESKSGWMQNYFEAVSIFHL